MSYRPYRPWIRCNACRTRRQTYTQIIKHMAISPECAPCKCGGYHFAHRKGSPYCYANSRAEYRHALRACESNEAVLDVLIDMALNLKQEPFTGECPF